MEDRFGDSKSERKKGPKDCLLGGAWIPTDGNNELGKMVEYKTMITMGFLRNFIPDGYANDILSGETSYKNATPEMKKGR